jgi:hypothetical protein
VQNRAILTVLILILVLPCAVATAQNALGASKTLQALKADLKANPGETIDRLNRDELGKLINQGQYEAVEELATTGTLALPADTWRIEVLQRYRVEALLARHKNDEALRAARGLFNVCGMGYVKDALPLLFQALAAARPQDPSLVPRLKKQILAGAREEDEERKREWEKVGGNAIMNTIQADPGPYEAAIKARAGKTAWRDLYGTGNLYLLSGNITKAKAIFDQVYAGAHDGELRYASEAKAKMIKADDGAVGRANHFVRSIRPAQ